MLDKTECPKGGEAATNIAAVLKIGDLSIPESTYPVGETDKMRDLVAKRGLISRYRDLPMIFQTSS